MNALRARLVAVYRRLDSLDGLWRLVVRLVVGGTFVDSAVKALADLHGFVEYFRSLHVPAPELQAPFVAAVELVAGALLVVGLATRPASVMLCGILCVALATAGIPEHHIAASLKGAFDFIYLPDFLLIVLMAGLVTRGAGPLSLDARLAKRTTATADSTRDAA